MLVLNVKNGECVRIWTTDGEIVVTLSRTLGPGLAKLGFEAPPAVKIWRDDITKREDFRGTRIARPADGG